MMKIRSNSYKRNQTVLLTAILICTPGATAAKGSFVLTLIATIALTFALFGTGIFSWQKKNIKWYFYYVYGVGVVIYLSHIILYLGEASRSSIAFWPALIGSLIYLVELHWAVEKEGMEKSGSNHAK